MIQDQKAIYSCALKRLGRRDYSVHELSTYLERKFPNSHIQINEVVRKLIQENLLDDTRFCQSVVRYRMSQLRGPAYISADLNHKGIDRDIASQALTAVNQEDWVKIIQKLIQKKINQPIADLSPPKRTKLVRYLYSRGFSMSQIKDAIDAH